MCLESPCTLPVGPAPVCPAPTHFAGVCLIFWGLVSLVGEAESLLDVRSPVGHEVGGGLSPSPRAEAQPESRLWAGTGVTFFS